MSSPCLPMVLTKMLTANLSGGIHQNPTWSPNAQYIAFSSNMEGKSEIFIMSANGDLLPNGRRAHRVTYIAGDNVMPAWSPK